MGFQSGSRYVSSMKALLSFLWPAWLKIVACSVPAEVMSVPEFWANPRGKILFGWLPNLPSIK